MDASLEEASRDLGANAVHDVRADHAAVDRPGRRGRRAAVFTLSLDEFVIAYFTAGPTTQTLPHRDLLHGPHRRHARDQRAGDRARRPQRRWWSSVRRPRRCAERDARHDRRHRVRIGHPDRVAAPAAHVRRGQPRRTATSARSTTSRSTSARTSSSRCSARRGCGKTTLLRSIAGFEQPDAGGDHARRRRPPRHAGRTAGRSTSCSSRTRSSPT